ncbi:hypothetical protein D3C85_1414510 [compost metagenome]
MDFDSLNVNASDESSRIQHHFMALLWQPVNNMRTDPDISFAKLLDCLQVTLGIMRAVN